MKNMSFFEALYEISTSSHLFYYDYHGFDGVPPAEDVEW